MGRAMMAAQCGWFTTPPTPQRVPIRALKIDQSSASWLDDDMQAETLARL